METLFPEPIRPYVPWMINVAAALAIFLAGWIVSKWMHRLVVRILRRREVDEALSRFLGALLQWAILAATVIVSLGQVGVATTSFVALLASAGLAIGLALQGNLGHFASGVMVLLFRPFTIGDWVTAGGETGTVEEIGLFATTLLTPGNERITVPNGTVTGNSIHNFTQRGTRRADIAIGVAYGTDLTRATEVFLSACKRCDKVLDDPAPSVFFAGFGASSLDFSVRPWASSSDYAAMLHEVRLALYQDLEAAGIEIPFDQVVLHQAPTGSGA